MKYNLSSGRNWLRTLSAGGKSSPVIIMTLHSSSLINVVTTEILASGRTRSATQNIPTTLMPASLILRNPIVHPCSFHFIAFSFCSSPKSSYRLRRLNNWILPTLTLSSLTISVTPSPFNMEWSTAVIPLYSTPFSRDGRIFNKHSCADYELDE
jgi:hypothetical protein